MEDQIWQGNELSVDAFDFTPNMEASFRVKIEGRLLDDDENDDEDDKDGSKKEGADDKMDEDRAADAGPKALPNAPQKKRFSHFFKSMNVEFDASRFRTGAEQNVEWKKPDPPRNPNPTSLPAAADFDELTFKRNGDENMNITINLHRHEITERYKLSPDLAEVVDMNEASQQEAVMGLWEYIRLMGLQEDEEKRNFRCDELLKKVGIHISTFFKV